jgi:hypothetical protein
MSDREKIEEVIRYMKDCIEDAKRLSIKDYNAVKAVYEYPLEVLEKSDKDEN